MAKKKAYRAKKKPRARGPGGQGPPTKLKIGRPKMGPRMWILSNSLFHRHFPGPPPHAPPAQIRPRGCLGFFLFLFFSLLVRPHGPQLGNAPILLPNFFFQVSGLLFQRIHFLNFSFQNFFFSFFYNRQPNVPENLLLSQPNVPQF